MLTRLARWWLNRKARHVPAGRVGECVCGTKVSGTDLHLVVAVPEDDERLGVGAGGTFMAADFCADCCPGGCRQGCLVRT